MIINLIGKQNERVSIKISGIFKIFKIMKLKSLLNNGYVFEQEEDANRAIELGIYN